MKFAVFLILIGLISTFLGSLIFAIITNAGVPLPEISKYWRLLLLFSVLHAGGLTLQNVSSQTTGLTLNQIVKSATPLITLILSWQIEGEKFTIHIVIVTSFMVFSAFLALFHNPEFGTWGFLAAVGSLLLQSLETVVLSILLKKTNFSALSIALTTSIPSAMMVAIPFAIFEFEAVIATAQSHTVLTAALLITSSILVFFYNITHFTLIWFTSAHYSVVTGQMYVGHVENLISSPIF